MLDGTMNEDTRDEALDLSALGLAPSRHAALTAGIVERGEPILARRRAARGPFVVLAAWTRPALAAAAVVMLAALAALLAERPREAAAVPTTTEALGFPAPVVAWAEAGRAPSLEELVVTMNPEVSP